MGAARELQRILRDMDRPLARRQMSRGAKSRGAPPSFAWYGDPLNRFEFPYPAEWILRTGASPTVISPRLGAFVRVDLLPATGALGDLLRQRLPGLRITKLRAGSPLRAEGTLPSPRRSYAWNAIAFELRALRIVLSSGTAAEPLPPSLDAYRRSLLDGIRRQFRLGPGLRSE